MYSSKTHVTNLISEGHLTRMEARPHVDVEVNVDNKPAVVCVGIAQLRFLPLLSILVDCSRIIITNATLPTTDSHLAPKSVPPTLRLKRASGATFVRSITLEHRCKQV